MSTPTETRDLAARGDAFLHDFDERKEPWEFFRELRSEAPALRTKSGTWLVSRHADCIAVLKDERLSRKEAARRTSALPEGEVADQYTTRLVCEDGANHRRLRRIAAGPFSPRSVSRWSDRLTKIADEVFAERSEPREMEFISEFCYPLPNRALCELLGVPHEDHERIGTWMSVLLEHINTAASKEFSDQKLAAMTGLAGYVRELLARRRTEPPQDDLLSAMIHAEAEGDRLTEFELVSILAELLHAGYESTANTLANGLYCLLQHPDQLERVAADPALVPTAFEEMLRFATPVLHALPRVALEDVDLPCGTTIPRGDMVLALVASAARDPEAVENPDEFDVARAPNPHVAFGIGEHYCLGANLARAEAVTTFRLLADGPLATMRLLNEPAWKPHHIVRGLDELRVAW